LKRGLLPPPAISYEEGRALRAPPAAWLALRVTVGAQAVIAFVPAIAPIIAPEMAQHLSFSPERVGMFSAITYLAAIISGLLVAPWIMWLGPVRATQIMLLTAAMGASLATLGSRVSLVLAAVVVGSSMGFPNPAFSAILGRHAPTGSIGLYLSLRQAAAPAGIALAGLLVPVSVTYFGWRGSIWSAAAVCVAASLAVGKAIPSIDWRADQRPRMIDLGTSLSMVVRHAALRRVSLVSMIYGMAQQGFLAYAVLLLVRTEVPVHVAAGLLSLSQLTSVLTRIALGHSADRWVSPRLLLALYGLAIAVACLALAKLPPSPPLYLAALVMALCGLTTMGWQSLLFAQLLRIAPRHQIARCVSGSQVFTFAGAMLGPFVMSVMLERGVSYGFVFLCVGALCAAAGLSLFAHRASRQAEQSQEAPGSVAR
jgi:MFS family permease